MLRSAFSAVREKEIYVNARELLDRFAKHVVNEKVGLVKVRLKGQDCAPCLRIMHLCTMRSNIVAGRYTPLQRIYI